MSHGIFEKIFGGIFACAAIIAAVLLVMAIVSGDWRDYGHYSMSFIGDVAFALYCFDLIEVRWLGIKNNT